MTGTGTALMSAVAQAGGLRLEERLGAGGAAEVYRAHDERLDRPVALKAYHRPITDEETRKNFDLECRIAARAGVHPQIATIYGAGVTDGAPWLAMQLFEGGSLAQRLKSGALSTVEALQITIVMAETLHWAHEQSPPVLHRDVKPGNILLDHTGRPTLSDFGIACVFDGTSSTSIAGFTPTFSAPEVLATNRYGVASEVWSLTAVLYQMLTGTSPFPWHPAGGIAAYIDRIRQAESAPKLPGGFPDSLRRLIVDGLSADLTQRPATMEVFAQRLRAVEAELGYQATKETVGPGHMPVDPPTRMLGTVVGTGTGIVVGTGTGTAVAAAPAEAEEQRTTTFRRSGPPLDDPAEPTTQPRPAAPVQPSYRPPSSPAPAYQPSAQQPPAYQPPAQYPAAPATPPGPGRVRPATLADLSNGYGTSQHQPVRAPRPGRLAGLRDRLSQRRVLVGAGAGAAVGGTVLVLALTGVAGAVTGRDGLHANGTQAPQAVAQDVLVTTSPSPGDEALTASPGASSAGASPTSGPTTGPVPSGQAGPSKQPTKPHTGSGGGTPQPGGGISLPVPEDPGPTLETGSLPRGTVGAAYSATPTASGGTTPYTWSAQGALPAGLTLDTATGKISGTPTTASAGVAFTLQVTDAKGKTSAQNLTIVVDPAPEPPGPTAAPVA